MSVKRRTRSVRSRQADPSVYVIPETTQRIRPASKPGSGRLSVLIITGRASFEHDWRGTTNAIRNLLEESGRFEVRVTEEFRGATQATLAPYDLVLLNYCGRWFYEDREEPRWGEPAESALFEFVRNGGGAVVYHPTFALGAPDWPEFERLAGATLRSTPAQSRRCPLDGFRIRVVDHHSPITKGLREYLWSLNDDMITNLRWSPATKDLNVLVTGYDDPGAYDARWAGPKYPASRFSPARLAAMPNMDRENPLVWTSRYGRGRVYSFTLGHAPDTLQHDAVASLLLRGAEWAGSGIVTIAPRDKTVAYPTSRR